MMTVMRWLRRHLPIPAARCGTLARVRLNHRPELLQLEDRLVPSPVVINPVSAPLMEGTAINLSAAVTGNTGVITGDWAVQKNGVPFASGAGTGADLSFSFTPDDN